MAKVVQFPVQQRKDGLRQQGAGLNRTINRVPETSIVIPAYNEEAGLGVVLEKLYEVIDDSYEVLVIDDGSTDATRAVASRYSCTVLSHTRNLGKGAALQTGIDSAQAEQVIFIDADDSYPVEAIPILEERLRGADVVFGERNTGRDNIPFFNRFGNRFIAGLLRILYGFKGTDPLTGFYGIKKERFQHMEIRSSGFAIEAEIALKAARMGLAVDGFSITYRERLGASKLRAIHDGYRICQTILGMLTMYSPSTLFVIPGAALFLISSVIFAALMVTPIAVGSFLFETNTLLAVGMLSLAGFQFATFGVALGLYGLLHKHTKPDRIGMSSLRLLTSPQALIAGVAALLVAGAVSLLSLVSWSSSGFGAFTDTSVLFLGAYLGIWGLQILLAALFLSALMGDLKARTTVATPRLVTQIRPVAPTEDVARAA
jgi:hypothetical protein